MGPGGFALCAVLGCFVCPWAAARPLAVRAGGQRPASLMVLRVAPRVFRALRGVLSGRAALCARGRRPARSPSAPRASLGASSRSPARPRHRPRAPQPGPPDPPGPSTPVGPGVLACGLVRRLEAPLQLLIINFARNSFMAHSNIECASLELQRFWGVSKNDRDKLRAKCGWWWCRRRPRRRSQALSARWPACLKPPSPLRAQAEPQLKPLSPLRAPAEPQLKLASPLRVKIGCFWRVFRLHW